MTYNKQKVAVGVFLTMGAALGVVAFLASHPSGASDFTQPVRACYGTASLCAALLSSNSPEQFRAMAGLRAETAKARSLFASPAGSSAFRGAPAKGAASPQRVRMAPQMSVGLYFSTTTGNTETVAGYLAGLTGAEATD